MKEEIKDKQIKAGSPDTKVIPEIDGAQANTVKEQEDEDEETLDLKEPAEEEGWQSHWPLLTALAVLLIMLTLEFGFKYQPPFPINLIIFSVAFLLAGYNVLGMAWRKAKHFDFFNEFFLMSVATLGAFSIGSYSGDGILFYWRMVPGFSGKQSQEKY